MLKHQQAYRIEEWTDWKNQIDQSVKVFQATHSVYPNILQCNEHTASQFDHLVNMVAGEREKVSHSKTGKPPKDGEDISLDAFMGEGYLLTFALDEELPDQVFRLVYDDNPEWENDDPKLAPKNALRLSQAGK